jgi:hypothetical protein
LEAAFGDWTVLHSEEVAERRPWRASSPGNRRPVADPLIDVRGVRRATAAAWPLRLVALTIGRASASPSPASMRRRRTLVNILTGATLPDEGEVRVFGRATSSISRPTTG